MINYYDQLADDNSADRHLRWKAAEAQMKVGNMRTSLADYEAAIAAYDQAEQKFVSWTTAGSSAV